MNLKAPLVSPSKKPLAAGPAHTEKCLNGRKIDRKSLEQVVNGA
jgi:hypothetical protein